MLVWSPCRFKKNKLTEDKHDLNVPTYMAQVVSIPAPQEGEETIQGDASYSF